MDEYQGECYVWMSKSICWDAAEVRWDVSHEDKEMARKQ